MKSESNLTVALAVLAGWMTLGVSPATAQYQQKNLVGKFSNALLIGNVENGRINAFDPDTGTFLGALLRLDGTPIEISGLWDLAFGGGGKNNGKKTNQLFFTAGLNATTFYGNGLFGSISAVGESAPDGE